MPKIEVGPTGNIVKGNVLDVGVKSFERALKDYDSQLYVSWEPQMLKGWGAWQIRRMPYSKVPLEMYDMGDYVITRLEYVETDILHRVLDCAFLNYDQLRKIKCMDTWNDEHWINDIEYREKKKREEIEARAKEELKYSIKQHASVFRQFLNEVNSGKSPHQIITETEWTY